MRGLLRHERWMEDIIVLFLDSSIGLAIIRDFHYHGQWMLP